MPKLDKVLSLHSFPSTIATMVLVPLRLAVSLTVVLLSSATDLRTQSDAVWRVTGSAGAARIEFGPEAVVDLVVQGEVERADGAFVFGGKGGHVTCPPDGRLGIDSSRSFTFTVELRTRHGSFATPMMCREGSDVHYSLVLGRSPASLPVRVH